MKKVLLIFEDYAESTRAQTYLKKVGFDVLVQNHEQRLSDLFLNFNPDVSIVFGQQKFTSLDLGTKLKSINHLKSKVILVLPQGLRPNPVELSKARVDILVEAPLAAEKLIQLIAKLTSLDPNLLLDKYKKAQISGEIEQYHVKGAGPAEARVLLNDPKRVEKYKKFVQEIHFDQSQTSHNRQAIKAKQNELKKGWDFKMLEEIDKLKRQFTQALFKK